MPAFFPIGAGLMGDWLAQTIADAPVSDSPAASGFWARALATAKRLITKYANGTVQFITKTVTESADPTDSVVGQPQITNIKALVFGYPDKGIDGEIIHAGDRQIFMIGDTLGRDPQKGEIINVDTRFHSIQNVEAIGAAGTVALYILQVRSA